MPTGIYQRKPLAEKHKDNIRKALKDKKRPPFSEDWKRNISKNNAKYWLGKHLPEKTKQKISKTNKIALRGRKLSEEHKRNISKGHSGKKHYNWQGGKSFEPYGLEFNEGLKEIIRNRDRRKCFICEKTELENKGKLMIHHIDYDKQNNNPNNLISLCRSCHTKTNYSRDYWIKFFKQIIIK